MNKMEKSSKIEIKNKGNDNKAKIAERIYKIILRCFMKTKIKEKNTMKKIKNFLKKQISDWAGLLILASFIAGLFIFFL